MNIHHQYNRSIPTHNRSIYEIQQRYSSIEAIYNTSAIESSARQLTNRLIRFCQIHKLPSTASLVPLKPTMSPLPWFCMCMFPSCAETPGKEDRKIRDQSVFLGIIWPIAFPINVISSISLHCPIMYWFPYVLVNQQLRMALTSRQTEQDALLFRVRGTLSLSTDISLLQVSPILSLS